MESYNDPVNKTLIQNFSTQINNYKKPIIELSLGITNTPKARFLIDTESDISIIKEKNS